MSSTGNSGSGSEGGQSTLERMMGERRDKADALRENGHNPYRNDFRPTHRCAALRARYAGTTRDEEKGMAPIDGEMVRIAGRMIARRGMGKTVFANVRDDDGELQLFINIKHCAEDDFQNVLPLLDVGDIVGAEGKCFWTKSGELSVLVERLWLVTKSLRPLPDKHHGLTDVEIRYRQRYLDLAIHPEVRDVFRKRSRIVAGIRRHLEARDFLEVETPMMHPIIGGAAARPFSTHHNALDIPLFMRIAPELYLKRLLVGGFERVYEINRNFRNEGLSRQHNPEFTMLEFYWAYATYLDLIELTEQMVVELADDVASGRTVTWDDVEVNLEPPWRRLSVKDAVEQSGRVSGELWDDPAVAAQAAVSVGVHSDAVARAILERLPSEAVAELGGADVMVAAFKKPDERPAAVKKMCERFAGPIDGRVAAGHIGYLVFEEVAESSLIQPTFLTDFPLAVSPLARKKESDPALCDRFELFVNGKEIANGFSELNDPDDQRSRFLAQVRAKESGADETMDYDEDYCRALELGMPSAAGEGIGIDRLTMLLCGQPSIRDVILFPLMRPE